MIFGLDLAPEPRYIGGAPGAPRTWQGLSDVALIRVNPVFKMHSLKNENSFFAKFVINFALIEVHNMHSFAQFNPVFKMHSLNKIRPD